MNPHKKLGTLCFLERNGHILMLHRAKEPNYGQWTAPGGKVEFHESPQDCIIREMIEETGYHIHQPRLFGLITEVSVLGDYNWLLFAFHCVAFDGEPIACPEGRLEWVVKERLLSLDMPESDYIFLPHLLSQKPGFFQGKFYYDAERRLVRHEIYPEKTVFGLSKP